MVTHAALIASGRCLIEVDLYAFGGIVTESYQAASSFPSDCDSQSTPKQNTVYA